MYKRQPFGSAVRSLLIAIYELGVEQVMVDVYKRQVKVIVTGSADASPIRGRSAYNGQYG